MYTAKNSKIGYLEQNSGLDSTRSILDEVLSVYSHFIEMENRIKELEKAISNEKDRNVLNGLMKGIFPPYGRICPFGRL